ncbi:MAG: helix-hairpin-helix domain-containing protein [Ignavibacteria bacterium]
MKEIFRKLGFTNLDLMLILFLLLTFAVGLVIKYSGWNNKKDFDYSVSDRNFEQSLTSSFSKLQLSSEKQERLKLLNSINDSLSKESDVSDNKTAGLSTGIKIDINLAYPADLELLPGIGKMTAERILEYREQNNGFTSIEEIMNVKGIGQKKFDRIKNFITVGSKTDNEN